MQRVDELVQADADVFLSYIAVGSIQGDRLTSPKPWKDLLDAIASCPHLRSN